MKINVNKSIVSFIINTLQKLEESKQQGKRTHGYPWAQGRIQKNLSQALSAQTYGLEGYKAAKKLFISTKNRLHRLEFDRAHTKWSVKPWNIIIFLINKI